MKTLIVIPTYNEAGNIQKLTDAIFELGIKDLSILVVDDNSPDGTAGIVRTLTQNNSQIHLIEREAKLGLGTAYVRGFKYALEHGYDLLGRAILLV